MQKPDLIGAFKIAAERGIPIDQVKTSLLNAGYPQQDIDDSAQAFSQGGFRLMPMSRPMSQPLPSLSGLTSKPGLQMSMPSSIEEKKKMPGYLIGAIIFTAVMVVGAIGFVVYTLLSG